MSLDRCGDPTRINPGSLSANAECGYFVCEFTGAYGYPRRRWFDGRMQIALVAHVGATGDVDDLAGDVRSPW